MSKHRFVPALLAFANVASEFDYLAWQLESQHPPLQTDTLAQQAIRCFPYYQSEENFNGRVFGPCNVAILEFL